jgi:acyl carrier protein
MFDEIVSILEDLNPGVDYANCTTLIDDRQIESLTMISVIAELEDAFDVTIPAVEVVPANFNSVNAMVALIERLSEDE